MLGEITPEVSQYEPQEEWYCMENALLMFLLDFRDKVLHHGLTPDAPVQPKIVCIEYYDSLKTDEDTPIDAHYYFFDGQRYYKNTLTAGMGADLYEDIDVSMIPFDEVISIEGNVGAKPFSSVRVVDQTPDLVYCAQVELDNLYKERVNKALPKINEIYTYLQCLDIDIEEVLRIARVYYPPIQNELP